MTTVVAMEATGGPEVLAVRNIELPPPAAGEVRIRHTSVGVNFVDIYQRQGLYPVPGLPAILGVEGAGIVEALGPDVSDLAIGSRVAYAGLPVGGYAQARNIPRWRVKTIPIGMTIARRPPPCCAASPRICCSAWFIQ